MATPIPELIAQELMTRLEGITEEAEYEFTVPSVTRVSRDGRDWTPEHNALAVVQEDEERLPIDDCPGNPPAIAYVQPYMILGFVRKPERQEYPDQQDVNRLVAAIKKAVATDNQWHTFDGNARDADWGTTTTERSPEHVIATIQLRVHYRISEYDPYTLRL